MGRDRRDCGRRCRAFARWVVGVFLLLQVAITVAVDQFAPAVRDPEYAILAGILKERVAEHPDKPLAMFVGSSRVAQGFDARRAAGDADVTPFNFGVPGTGPYFQAVMLDRLRAAGVKADLLFLELLHPFYNAAGPRVLDHSLMDGARLSAREAEGLRHYGTRSQTGPLKRWAYARALPFARHQTEVQESLGLSMCRPGEGPPPPIHPVDPYGFRPRDTPPNERPGKAAIAHQAYDPFYRAFRLDPHPWDLLRGMIDRARADGTEVVVVLMPEGSGFRKLFTPEAEAGVQDMMRRLREEVGVTVVDARAWVPDGMYADEHHLLPPGAEVFSDRFRAEAFEPAGRRLDRRQVRGK